ncbi:MAG: MFS transporter, partial [Dehalococcoidia bacterium]|nr:MFS transporter [Dehalococcoidia bacterium]
VFGLGFGIIFPAVTALTAEAVQWSSRGKAFGVFYAVFSVGVVIGAVVSGTFTQHLGQSTVMPYIFSGLVALAASPVITLVWRLCKGTRAE